MILVAEDNASDEKLTVVACQKCGVPNQVIVLRVGADALDYLFGTGKYTGQAADVLPSVKTLGLFWLDMNEPAPAARGAP